MATTTILMVKERLAAEWPESADGDTPSGPGDLKLILSGQILDNAKTLAGTSLFHPDNASDTSDSTPSAPAAAADEVQYETSPGEGEG